MELVVTYCAGPKRRDRGPLPAVQRYLSGRIEQLAAASGGRMRILSGEFGLLETDEPIPWYDHLLTTGEVDQLAVTVADQLLECEAVSVRYHTADPEAFPRVGPYLLVMEKACRFAGIPLETVLLEGNPD